MGRGQETERMGCAGPPQVPPSFAEILPNDSHQWIPGPSTHAGAKGEVVFLSQTRGIAGQPEKEEVDVGRLIGTQWEP